jgi:hypothetical protein
MPTRTGVRLPLLIALLIVLAGCSGAGGGTQLSGGGDGGGQNLDYAATTNPEVAGDADGGSGGGGDAGGAGDDVPQIESRAIIRTGHVVLEVDDFDRSTRNLSRTTERHGGFVGDTHEENHRVDNETYTTGRIVLRVPQENYSALMADIQAEGIVEQTSNETEDVSEQLVDIEARLGNLRAERDRLRELYRQANETEDVIAVEKRLSEVQTEIERIEARQQALERRVAYSTITVEMREPRPERDFDPSRWYDTPVWTAFVESIHGVVVVLRALVVGFAFALPYLLAFSPAVAAGVLGWRRFRSGDGDAGESSDATDEEADDADGDDHAGDRGDEDDEEGEGAASDDEDPEESS